MLGLMLASVLVEALLLLLLLISGVGGAVSLGCSVGVGKGSVIVLGGRVVQAIVLHSLSFCNRLIKRIRSVHQNLRGWGLPIYFFLKFQSPDLPTYFSARHSPQFSIAKNSNAPSATRTKKK